MRREEEASFIERIGAEKGPKEKWNASGEIFDKSTVLT
jgi:hypothetical protein